MLVSQLHTKQTHVSFLQIVFAVYFLLDFHNLLNLLVCHPSPLCFGSLIGLSKGVIVLQDRLTTLVSIDSNDMNPRFVNSGLRRLNVDCSRHCHTLR